MQPNTKGELVLHGFDYASIDRDIAERAQSSAVRIREQVKKTLETIIEVGTELGVMKEALPHGLFSPWLRAEFGWTERTARNFMAVAERFGPKTEIISDLAISPTAAYMLAAPSAPDEARQTAVERAEAGERITTTIAKEILAETRKKGPGKAARLPFKEVAPRISAVLRRYREQCTPEDLMKLAQQLREFADDLDRPARGGKRDS
jgi:hypothetical protein